MTNPLEIIDTPDLFRRRGAAGTTRSRVEEPVALDAVRPLTKETEVWLALLSERAREYLG